MKRLLSQPLILWAPLTLSVLYISWALLFEQQDNEGNSFWFVGLGVIYVLAMLLTMALLYFRDELQQHRQTEESVSKRQQLIEALLRQLPTAVYLLDLKDDFVGRIVETNEAACRALGYTRNQLVGQSIAIIDSGLQSSQVAVYLEQVNRLGRLYFQGFNRRADGLLYPVEVVAQRIELNGHPYCLCLEQDISERNRAESKLRDSEERYRLLAEYSTDMICRSTLEGVVLYVSPACRQILGYEPEEIVGKSFHSFHHPDDYKATMEQPNPVMSGAKQFTVQYRARHKNGSYVWIETSVRLVFDPITHEPRELIAGARDISQRKHLEEQLKQAAKMEAVGRLAGGIAHDFNNLLTVIGGFTAIVLQDATANARHIELLKHVQSASERAATLTRQLLAFSRKQILQPAVLDVNTAVRALHSLLDRLIGENIEVKLELSPELPAIKVDPGQIDQVLLNLAVNARDAMPAGGQLTLRTGLLTATDAPPHAEVPTGKWVTLQVADTGSGIPPEVLPYIFEPFFTTKGVGEGTGLGLASVYGVVKQSDGHLFVDSQVGVGTTFTLYFPAMMPSAQGTAPAREPPPAQGAGTVLLVEDEDQLRELARLILAQRGYRVLQAKDGEHGLTVSREHNGPIDIVLTDVVMPRLSGPEMVRRLKHDRPGLKVVYMSGYSEGEQRRQTTSGLDGPLLAKPFSPGALVQCIQATLNAIDNPQGKG